MHIRIQDPEILIQGFTNLFQYLQVHSSNVSSNRIKIQLILLILQLETDYFSSYSFQKCSIRSSGTTVFTETSRTAILHEEVLQDSSAPILQGYPYSIHPHTTYMCTITLQYIQRILHPESNSTCRRQRALRVLLLLHPEGKRDLHSRKKILRIEGKEIF